MVLKCLDKERNRFIIGEYKIHDSDTGSPEVQITILSERISYLETILRYTSRTIIPVAASETVSQRRSLLDYLKGSNKNRYERLLSVLV